MNDRSQWLARALRKRGAGILLTTAVFAGTAFAVSSIVLPAEATGTRVVILDRGSVSPTLAAGSVGELAPTAGRALAAGFQASTDILSGRDPAASPIERLAEILRTVPAGSGPFLSDARATELALAVRDVAARHLAETASGRSSILADLSLPTEPATPLSGPIAALAGLVGLLASSVGAAVAEARTRRRRSPVSRWETPYEHADMSARSNWDEPQAEDLRPIGDLFEIAVDRTASFEDRLDPQVTVSQVNAPTFVSPVDAASAIEDATPAPLTLAPPPGATVMDAELDDLSEAAVPGLPRPLIPLMDPYDLAEAAISIGMRTLLVTEAGEGVRSCGGVDLVRALAGLGTSSILLDLGFDRVIADDLGIEARAAGLSDLLTGAADISAIIHRDVASRADAIVWGRDEMADPIQGERLFDLFAHLGDVYDCVVIIGGTTFLPSLAGLLDETGAAIVSVRPGDEAVVEDRLAGLAGCGLPQTLLMAAYPRNLHPVALAA